MERGRELRHGDRAVEFDRRPALELSGAAEAWRAVHLTFKSSHAEPVSPMMRENVVVSDHIVRWNVGT